MGITRVSSVPRSVCAPPRFPRPLPHTADADSRLSKPTNIPALVSLQRKLDRRESQEVWPRARGSTFGRASFLRCHVLCVWKTSKVDDVFCLPAWLPVS
jgi:hypothetical protein